MIKVAEMEDASDELIFEAINFIKVLYMSKNVTAMEGVINNLSQEDTRRVVTIAMKMMGCIYDDILWFEVVDDPLWFQI
ncbi:importin-5, partial [Trifolium medium]|nr:importin-5 [Trifolium medium]